MNFKPSNFRIKEVHLVLLVSKKKTGPICPKKHARVKMKKKVLVLLNLDVDITLFTIHLNLYSSLIKPSLHTNNINAKKYAIHSKYLGLKHFYYQIW